MIQTIYDQHFEGFERVKSYIKSWKSLKGQVDEATYDNVAERLERQLENATEKAEIELAKGKLSRALNRIRIVQ